MTATIEAPAVVILTTADGESRSAQCDAHGSWSCPFCSGAVISPAGWQASEDANAQYYATAGRGEGEYERSPYSSYMRDSWEAQRCGNPGCLVNMSAEYLAQAREHQRREDERKRIHEAELKRREDAAAAAERRKIERRELLATVRGDGAQLGFAWACAKEIPAERYGQDPAVCGASGYERSDFEAHMRGHGLKSPAAPKLIRLRKAAPKASMPKLDFSPFKRATWQQSHTEPATCKRCDHPQSAHHVFHGTAPDGGSMSGSACEQCDCRGSVYGTTAGETVTAERRGQFWALGPDAHSAWFLPTEPAPWETGRPAPVLLYLGAPGQRHADFSAARYERKRAA